MSDVAANPIIKTDWSRLTLGEQIRHFEVEGYLVLPDLLTPEQVASLKEATAQFETYHVDYSVKQRGKAAIQWWGGAITELIAHEPAIAFLKKLFGDEVVMMSYDYSRSEPGHPGVSLHCDGQPWGSEIFGFEHSCPRLVRVLYYLDDLTPEVSPFCVVPRSHLSFHNEANPYRRYSQHPEQVMVTARAGSAALINQNVFHGNYPNVGDRSRELLAIAYRPAWAGPAGEVAQWDVEQLAKVPDSVRELMTDRNQRVWTPQGGNKPADMQDSADGIAPSRWERTQS